MIRICIWQVSNGSEDVRKHSKFSSANFLVVLNVRDWRPKKKSRKGNSS